MCSYDDSESQNIYNNISITVQVFNELFTFGLMMLSLCAIHRL